jgi:hypothetical protein
MRRTPQKRAVTGAKPRDEIRPLNGMPRSAALICLGLLALSSGCFNVDYGTCRITCSASALCPEGLRCLLGPDGENGLCAPPNTDALTCFPAQPDAGTDADAMDASDASDAMDGGDADGMSLPPSVLCHGSSCLTLPEAVRANLVLLLWPSNLPPLGSPVSVWSDQSGKDNDAHALYPSALPHVIANGVQLDPNPVGSGFVILNSPSLDFGSGDFTVIVVAGLSSSTARVSFFRKSDRARENSRQISIDWVLSSALTGRPQGIVNDTPIVTSSDIAQPSVGAYTLRRTSEHLEIRLNEAVLGSADLPAPGLTTTNAEDVFLGVDSFGGSPADSIAAVVAIRGPVASGDLTDLLAFLRTLFATSQ